MAFSSARVSLIALLCGCLCFTLVHGQCALAGNTGWWGCLLPNATQLGAVCLDGSPFGYFYRPASTVASQNKWVIYMQGGGVCWDEQDCAQRATTYLGSSSDWAIRYPQYLPLLSGIFSTSAAINPTFSTWSVVYMPYCDGASFTGDVADPVQVGSSQIYFRGRRIFAEAIKQFKEVALDNATDVVLTGSSAGALATYYHLDRVKAWLPNARVLGVPDSGWLVDINNLGGTSFLRPRLQHIYAMQNASAGLDPNCVAAYGASDAWNCYFPERTYRYITTPVFVSNPTYDTWQLMFLIATTHTFWGNCLQDRSQCTTEHIEAAQYLYNAVVTSLSTNNVTNVFGLSCWMHVINENRLTWSDTLVDGASLATTVAAFYADHTAEHVVIDGPYPGGCGVVSPSSNPPSGPSPTTGQPPQQSPTGPSPPGQTPTAQAPQPSEEPVGSFATREVIGFATVMAVAASLLFI